jgi:hypothetical protein
MSPARRAKKAAKAKLECCRHWAEIPETHRREWRWQVLHQMGHGRTTFSAGTLADLARVGGGEAAELIREGELRKWIWTPQPGIWVGQLSTRR